MVFEFKKCWRFPALRFFWSCRRTTDTELHLLQSTKHDVSGSYKFFKDGKVGVRGNMKLDRYHDELEFVNGFLVHVDKNDPTVVGKVLPRCV